MTRGSCLTFQLPTPSRQQPHPRAWRELGLGQCGGLGAASQALPVWVSPAWDGAAGRLNGAGQDRRHPCSAALQPPCCLQPLGLRLARSAWGCVPGMGPSQGPWVLLLAPCFPHCRVPHADGAFLRGKGPLPALSHPGWLSGSRGKATSDNLS